MRVIGYLTCTAGVVGRQEEIKPSRSLAIQQIADFLTSKFLFKVDPQSSAFANEATQPGPQETALRFEHGTFDQTGANVPIPRMIVALWSDPATVVVQSSDTESAELVLDEVISVLSESGFRNLATLRRLYSSNVVVEFDEAIERQVTQISAIQRIVSSALCKQFDLHDSVGLERLSFGFDPAKIPSNKAAFVQGFSLERRVGTDFKNNRYFSTAPIPSPQHVQVLRELASVIER